MRRARPGAGACPSGHALEPPQPDLAQTARRRALLWLVAAVGTPLLAGGCSVDNGLPADLAAHLATHGVPLRIKRSHAPLTDRAGVVVIARDTALEQRIVLAFGLTRIERDDVRFARRIPADLATRPDLAVWGVEGRPASLRLQGGGQLEYLYLITTADEASLLAEYAYG